MKANEPLELVRLYTNCPETMTRVGTKLTLEYREALKQLLIEHIDVFAWSHEEIPGIDNKVIEYKLCVDLTVKKVR